MKKQKYRIIGVIAILLLVLSIVVIPRVSALGDAGISGAETCSNPAYKYGLYIEQDENDGNVQYILRRINSSSCTDSDKPLKISNVSGYGSSVVGRTINVGEEIILGGDSVMVNSGNVSKVTVGLIREGEEEEVEEETGNPWLDLFGAIVDSFSDSTILVEYSVIEEQAVTGQIDTSGLETATPGSGGGTTITTPEFDAIFNDIYTKAQSAGHTYNGATLNSQMLGENESFNGLKCSPTIKDASGNLIDNSGTNYYQEVNSDYFYAEEKTLGDSLTYTYNYVQGGTPVKQTIDHACERICQEALKVEYGMPVSSKAGLCFEYKVKVTSYVKCTTTTTATPPPKPSGQYCNPAPKCVSQEGTLRDLPQAGPTEEFDSCVNECDGGKYSEKCSLKCYKKVYGKNPKTKLAVNFEDYTAQRLADASSYSLSKCLEDNKDYYGCYYKDGSKMKWASYNREQTGNLTDRSYYLKDLGRWYIDQFNRGSYNLHNIGNNSGLVCNSQIDKCYIVDKDGFFRRDYKNSGLCKDICEWRTDQCAGQYMNPGTAISDYKENLQKYKDAVASCEAAASCSTTTAEFTISADYNYNNGGTVTTKRVNFPYSDSGTSKDKLGSRGAASIVRTDTNSNTTILDYDGCYKASGAENEYMTEWGFPGTWIHNKTGALSYKPTTSEGYYLEAGKYCLPLNALSVNTEWWEYAETTGCYTSAPVPKQYNIIAETNKFGYFGWNLRIRCFYAVRNEACNKDAGDLCCDPVDECETGDSENDCDACTGGNCDDKEGTVINYRIRSVDLDNLFPNETERETGFNWTSEATISTSKDPNYAVDPEMLKANIEAKGTENTYTPGELEYSFELTPEILREIRKDNKKQSYDELHGDYKTVAGRSVNFYTSNFFTKFFNSNQYKNLANLGRNNSNEYIGGDH